MSEWCAALVAVEYVCLSAHGVKQRILVHGMRVPMHDVRTRFAVAPASSAQNGKYWIPAPNMEQF